MHTLATCLVVVLLGTPGMQGAHAQEQELSLNLQPMYGGLYDRTPSTDAERDILATVRSIDEKFIKSVLLAGHTMQSGAVDAATNGFVKLKRMDMTGAMKRFNQAWVLDPEYGDTYHGYAVLTAMQEGPAADVETYFKLAMSKPNLSTQARVDYGRFLAAYDRPAEALEQLHRALELDPAGRNVAINISYVHYLAKDFTDACTWAKHAEQNGDDFKPDYVGKMCNR